MRKRLVWMAGRVFLEKIDSQASQARPARPARPGQPGQAGQPARPGRPENKSAIANPRKHQLLQEPLVLRLVHEPGQASPGQKY